MSVTLDILRTYRAPGQVLRRRVAGPPNEPRALIILMTACILMFVSSLPEIARQAYFDPSIDRDGMMVGAMFLWIFIAPLFLYGLAALAHLIFRLFGGKASWYEARMSLFWALLCATPLWLLVGLVEGFVGDRLAQALVAVIAGLAFVFFWGAGLREVERGPA